ncbi:MAG: GNAT family N-acetyltransferase [Myxococcales bacterium]|nr:GNAT family N-acetyltransferase [Myxococcales bacterium]
MSRAGVVVRAADTRELDRLTELHALLVEHHGAHASFAPVPGAEAAVRAHLGRAHADPAAALWVADAERPLVGFVLVRVLERPPLFAETRRGEVEALFVRPEARRAGVGRALAEAGVAWLREQGLGRVCLEVAAANPEGGAFWRALGFEPSMDVLERRL